MTATDVRTASHRLHAVVLALALVVAGLVTGVVSAPHASASTTENGFVSRINHARAAHGLQTYAVRGDLARVARAQARRMAARGALYHNPNLTRDVRNFRWVGENVGYGPGVWALSSAFMHSPAHRANILDRDFTEVGVGAVYRAGRLWVAEVFRRPMHTSHAVGYTRVLHLGSTGADVKRVQRRLGLRVTGVYNHATKRAVGQFQRHLGWRGRGNVGRATWRHLF